jgi:hypothetical protein
MSVGSAYATAAANERKQRSVNAPHELHQSRVCTLGAASRFLENRGTARGMTRWSRTERAAVAQAAHRGRSGRRGGNAREQTSLVVMAWDDRV